MFRRQRLMPQKIAQRLDLLGRAAHAAQSCLPGRRAAATDDIRWGQVPGSDAGRRRDPDEIVTLRLELLDYRGDVTLCCQTDDKRQMTARGDFPMLCAGDTTFAGQPRGLHVGEERTHGTPHPQKQL